MNEKQYETKEEIFQLCILIKKFKIDLIFINYGTK